MRVQKYIEVDAHPVADFRSSLGGRLLCQVDVYSVSLSMLWLCDIPIQELDISQQLDWLYLS